MVNAIVHKDHSIEEPVTMSVFPEGPGSALCI